MIEIPDCTLTLADVSVQVRYKLGDRVEIDFLRDSELMLEVMDRFGAAIFKTYHWTPSTHQLCYLMIDNSVGHGTKNAIIQY